MADFAIPKDPTNNDIMLILVQMNSTLEAVKAQAMKTNGRVNSIEEWKTGLQAVAQFQKEHPVASQTVSAPNAKTVVMAAPKWFQNDRLVTVLVVITGILAGVFSLFIGGSFGK